MGLRSVSKVSAPQLVCSGLYSAGDSLFSLYFFKCHNQGWEKSIFDCDILYFLFIECTGAFTFLNEYRIWTCLYFFFQRESIFRIRFFFPGYFISLYLI